MMKRLVKEASNYAQTIFHPVGTCKMGQDDMAVVDDQLKVHGIKNLKSNRCIDNAQHNLW